MRFTATQKGANAIFLFIAELNGFKSGTPTAKLRFGQQCWFDTVLHDLDHTSEEDRKEVHENIWLQRLYDELDSFYSLGELVAPIVKSKLSNGKLKLISLDTNANHKWSTPIELDASASMLQYIGILLGDERLLNMTNVIGSTLSDPWAFNGIPRTQFKHAATPRLYGSSRACHELWQDKGHKYTLEQVQLFNQELSSGPLGLADQFKEFIINNVKPSEAMTVDIFGTSFRIECNRYRNVGEQTLRYDIYDSETDTIRRIAHTTTKRVPDLDQFRRYFVTLLIHHLDSRVADNVISKVMDKYSWGIDIHDAFIVNPEAAEDTRAWYAEELKLIFDNRHTILADYFKSIGIGAEAQGSWNTVKSMVHPVTEPLNVSLMALK